MNVSCVRSEGLAVVLLRVRVSRDMALWCGSNSSCFDGL
jgi:hypothetical protein